MTRKDTNQNGFNTTYMMTKEGVLIPIHSAVDIDYFTGLLKAKEINTSHNYYTTKNTYRIPKTHQANKLLGLQSIVIDIDLSLSLEDKQREHIKKTVTYALVNDHSLPFSRIIDSGRGLHIYIDFEQTSYVLGRLYNQVEESLVKEYNKVLKEIKQAYDLRTSLEVDKKNMGAYGLTRLIGSTNQRTKTKVKEIYSTNREYRLPFLHDDYVLDKTPSKRFKTRTRASKDFSERLATQRTKIIESLEIEKGSRNETLYLYYNYLIIIDDNAEETLKQFNRTLKQPLKTSELEGIIRGVNRRGHYYHSDVTFYGKLDMDIPSTQRVKSERYVSKQLAKQRIKQFKRVTVTESNKDIVLLLYYNYLSVFDSNADMKLRAFNKTLDQPFNDDELQSIINAVEEVGHYRYTNDKFYKELEISPPLTRDQERAIVREKKAKETQKVIELLKDRTLTHKAIAEQTKESLSTVKRIAKSNGLTRYKK